MPAFRRRPRLGPIAAGWFPTPEAVPIKSEAWRRNELKIEMSGVAVFYYSIPAHPKQQNNRKSLLPSALAIFPQTAYTIWRKLCGRERRIVAPLSSWIVVVDCEGGAHAAL
jgi:hypothetical protein